MVLAAAIVSLLMAPSAYHRIRFRSGDKTRMLFIANRLIIAKSFLLAVGMICAVYVVTAVLFGSGIAGIVVAAVGGWFLWFWYGLPVYHHLRHGGGIADESDSMEQVEADDGGAVKQADDEDGDKDDDI